MASTRSRVISRFSALTMPGSSGSPCMKTYPHPKMNPEYTRMKTKKFIGGGGEDGQRRECSRSARRYY